MSLTKRTEQQYRHVRQEKHVNQEDKEREGSLKERINKQLSLCTEESKEEGKGEERRVIKQLCKQRYR